MNKEFRWHHGNRQSAKDSEMVAEFDMVFSNSYYPTTPEGRKEFYEVARSLVEHAPQMYQLIKEMAGQSIEAQDLLAKIEG